ncbi:DUF2786 domain-containing protein [Streptomyces sp. ID38640]|uniref:DUF2786 domain-containing protein n=1 Tax=Streptomyces sp. ID38640 TaxID=1265399 RepID=UPI00140EFCBC|nr:DUF2786 domain-containing protein [Streptomyces sp. ID38640]QIK06136.1 DUF2786 domain-containing protein [Streptomyces sp. ID38640]
MTENSAAEGSASVFAAARKEWLRNRVTELSEVLADFGPDFGPGLHALVPSDLGDRRLALALVLTRIAADEARVRPVPETVAWLELLIPNGHRHELSLAVREIRSSLTAAEDPALWSWNAEAWEELMLALWRRDRALAVGPGQADDELISRWGVRAPVAVDIHSPERAPQEYGLPLSSLTGYLASETEPVSLLAQAVLSQEDVVDSTEDSLAVCEETLQNADHLAFLAEQQLCARYLCEWCQKQASDASEVTEAFLMELSELVETYCSQVVQPVIGALSACERALFHTAALPDRRARHEYLTEFLDCAGTPTESAWAEGALDDGGAREAGDRRARGELTWHGMCGSVPAWYHIVTSPQERAAALAFSGAATSSAIRIHADVERAQQLDLFPSMDGWDARDEPEDWYPEPGIELRYSRHSAVDLCELLALGELGHARLEFLVQGADGSFIQLRSLRAEICPGDAAEWARGALTGLRALVPNVDDLADVITREYEEEGASDDADDWVGPDAPGIPSDGEEPTHRDQEPAGTSGANGSGEPAANSRTGGPLPTHLLARVKAILRQAEDPGATPAESEAFLQKATALMAKYGIEQAMLHGDEPSSEQPADRVVEVTAPWMRECQRLLGSIASRLRCQAISPGGKANRHRVHLFGFASDLHAVEILYASLRLQMLRGAELADAKHRPVAEASRAYKRSWMLGFIRAVALRIGEAERAAREDTERDRQEDSTDVTQGRSVALVLADRTAAIDDKVAARYPKVGKARRTRFTGSGYRQGHIDGQQADIGGLTLEDEDEQERIA